MFPFLPTQSNEALAQVEDMRVFGWDPLPGIVSVWANREGRAVCGGAWGGVLRLRRSIFVRGSLLRCWKILLTWERPWCLLVRPAGMTHRLAITNWIGLKALRALRALKALIVICFPRVMDERLNVCC